MATVAQRTRWPSSHWERASGEASWSSGGCVSGRWALPASWGIGDGAMHVVGPLVISAKAVLLVGVMFWVRFTLPRFREDQLQRIAWKFLIPISLANIVVTGVLKVVF